VPPRRFHFASRTVRRLAKPLIICGLRTRSESPSTSLFTSSTRRLLVRMRLQYAGGWDKLPKRGTYRCARQEAKAMIRRDFIKLGVASLSAYPLAATAQRSIPVIGALSPAARPTQFNSSIYAAFAVGMRELGYVEGKLFNRVAICRRRLSAPPRIGERSRQVESQHHIRNEYAIDSGGVQSHQHHPDRDGLL
jgi:hypothetical protein